MAKLFGQKPSDIALLDESVGPIHRFYFDRGIAAFGQAVHMRVEQAGQSRNPVIAKAQRAREWERLMGGDMSKSATGFADPSSESLSAHGMSVGRDDSGEEEMILDGEVFW